MNNAQGFLRVIPFLVGIVAGYVASLLLGLVDLAPVAVASISRIPNTPSSSQ